MNLTEYFKQNFWMDIAKIPTERPNKIILENPEGFFVHKEILFFGGGDWKSYETDISLIDENSREDFIFSLLMSSTIDYYYKNNRNKDDIDLKYDVPKLGNCGYGPRFEHPYVVIKKWISKQDLEYDLYYRKEETKELFKNILLQHSWIDETRIKKQIIENRLIIPEIKEILYFFELLEDDNIPVWEKMISQLINN
jgi:hypothetical protein